MGFFKKIYEYLFPGRSDIEDLYADDENAQWVCRYHTRRVAPDDLQAWLNNTWKEIDTFEGCKQVPFSAIYSVTKKWKFESFVYDGKDIIVKNFIIRNVSIETISVKETDEDWKNVY